MSPVACRYFVFVLGSREEEEEDDDERDFETFLLKTLDGRTIIKKDEKEGVFSLGGVIIVRVL